jgi:anti-sigma factor RsiW
MEPCPSGPLLTCRELTSFIADYIGGELPAEVQKAFEHHLSLCPNCVQYVADYRRAVALGRGAFDDDATAVSETVPEDVVAAILAARRTGA